MIQLVPILIILFLLLAFLIGSKLYMKATIGMCRSKERMDGKTVIITGSNCGIGKETAKELYKRGAKVILAVRSLDRGEKAAEQIKSSIKNEAARQDEESTGANRIRVMECDLSSLTSVRSFSQRILQEEQRLDVLILNAGMVPPPGKFLTNDGIEVQFQSNHLGHFLLTNLLIPLLRRSAPSRIVIVSSCLHVLGHIDFDNLNYQQHTPDPGVTYCMTKLCNVLMAQELSSRLDGTGVTANSCHPGLVKTDINRRTPWYIKRVIQPISYIWAKNATEGAQTQIYLSVSPELEKVTGKYFSDCRPVEPSFKCSDIDLAKKLWSVSEQLSSGVGTNV